MKKADAAAEEFEEYEIPFEFEQDPFAWIMKTRRQRLTPEQVLKEKPTLHVLNRHGANQVLITHSEPPSITDPKHDNQRKALGERLAKTKDLVGPQSVEEFHEWISAVHEHAPWMSQVSEHVMNETAARMSHGVRCAGFSPVLVHGAPGVGKTHYARALGDATGVPVLVLDGGTMTSVFQIAGLERGWSGACASPLVEMIARTQIANPIVVVDECDKIPAIDGRGGNPQNALLGMLEGVSAHRWRCPFTEMVLDLRGVSWILTANNINAVAPPLRDRCRVIEARKPTANQIRELVMGRMYDQDPRVIEHLVRMSEGKSLRAVSRAIDAAMRVKNMRMVH